MEKEAVAFYSAAGYASALYAMDKTQLTPKEYDDIADRMDYSVNDRLSNETLFNLCKTSLETEPNRYPEEDKRLLQKYVRDGCLGGLHLDTNKRAATRRLSYALDEKMYQCKMKITYSLDNVHTKITDGNRVKDFPEDLLR